ncbi:MOSC domain-containing protein [bacterium]|nr:MOSC domain-containing protein [bacterium]
MTLTIKHLTTEELEAGLVEVHYAPKDGGELQMIVRRPAVEERELIQTGNLDIVDGLVGDNWRDRGSSSMPDGSANPDAQITLMNARAAQLVAQDKERWPLAGDQLYVDFDLSEENIPPGTRLAIGDAVVEVSALPHNGCKKFVARFGLDAMKFVNSPVGKQLHLRGINAKVVQGGAIRVGDSVKKVIPCQPFH